MDCSHGTEEKENGIGDRGERFSWISSRARAALSRSSGQDLDSSPNVRLASLGVEQVHGSIVDPDVCLAAVAGVSAVYHVAGTVARTPDDAGFLYDVHVNGTRNVLNACLQHSVENVVYVSTSGTVGVGDNDNFMATESTPVPWDIIGQWPYYESKALAEREVQHFLGRAYPFGWRDRLYCSDRAITLGAVRVMWRAF